MDLLVPLVPSPEGGEGSTSLAGGCPSSRLFETWSHLISLSLVSAAEALWVVFGTAFGMKQAEVDRAAHALTRGQGILVRLYDEDCREFLRSHATFR